MAGRSLALRHEVRVAAISVTGVAATIATALVFEAVTDRDWSITDWEWPEITTLAVLTTLGAMWLLLQVTLDCEGVARSRATNSRRPRQPRQPRRQRSPVHRA
jgi:hypothetical protein